jgi:Type IIA topoisomerase (DNA gyrase/topo II, topoisomerase IV), A subunit
MVLRGNDLVRHIVVADAHDNLLFFTSSGRVYPLKCYEIPEDSSRTTKGIALVNLLPVALKDEVTALLAVSDFPTDKSLLMVTLRGVIKKTPLSKFASIRRNGLIAMGLKNGDKLVSARVVADDDEVILISQKGQAIRFRVGNLRSASRTSGGVRGIRLIDDCVVGVDVVVGGGKQDQDTHILIVTQNGFGKLTPTRNYPVHNRSGKGVRTYRPNEKTGLIAVAKLVTEDNKYLVLLSAQGSVVCIPIEQVSVQSRSGRGVHVMTVDEGDSVVSLATPDIWASS